jgi:hypothetical protein
MVDDTADQQAPPADSGRARRAGPTIDLTATVVSEEKGAEAAATPDAPEPEPESKAAPEPKPERPQQRIKTPASPWLVAPLSGAVAAALVIAVGWMLGWVPGQEPSPAAQPNAAVIEDLTARLTSLEAKAVRPAAPSPDPVPAGRVAGLEESVAALRADVTNLRAQSDRLSATINEAKGSPGAPANTPDLAALKERIARIEQTTSAQGAEIAKDGARIADARPADDLPLRRVVAASLLDVAVRHGDPYAALLATAKSLAPNAEALKPLEAFAATGVPNPPALDRELLTLVPKLSPPAPENSTTGSGIVDRLQAGAAKLVHIERTDSVGTDRGAVVGRITAAALRNDFAEARRELNTLAAADRAPAQAWLDKADARDAALAASRHLADEAMTALAQPAQ